MTTERAAISLARLLTVQELADLLQIPTKTIYTWRYKGIGPPAVPMGKYLRFRADDIAAWLDTRADPRCSTKSAMVPGLDRAGIGQGARDEPGPRTRIGRNRS